MHQSVEHLVADEAAGRLRQLGRYVRRAQRREHALDRQRGKIRRRGASHHGRVDGLSAGIVGNARIDQVDRDAFERDAAASAGLAECDHERGPVLAQQRVERAQRAREFGRQFGRDDAMAGDDLAVERTRDFERGIRRFAAERIESGEEGDRQLAKFRRSFHWKISPAIRITLTTSSTSAVGHCARITPYWSRSSSSTAGTMLKFAAIGVSSVPQ